MKLNYYTTSIKLITYPTYLSTTLMVLYLFVGSLGNFDILAPMLVGGEIIILGILLSFLFLYVSYIKNEKPAQKNT